MGFESYTVVLGPKQPPSSDAGHETNAVQHLAGDLQREWPHIRLDEEELCSFTSPLVEGEVPLVYETAQGLFQMLLTPSLGQVSVSMRFAYCNPRTVYPPFVAMIVWLMENYKLNAYVMASDDIPDLTDPQEVEAVLVPSMDDNRHFWQADAGTNEEAILRPVEAVKRFIALRPVSATLVQAGML